MSLTAKIYLGRKVTDKLYQQNSPGGSRKAWLCWELAEISLILPSATMFPGRNEQGIWGHWGQCSLSELGLLTLWRFYIQCLNSIILLCTLGHWTIDLLFCSLPQINSAVHSFILERAILYSYKTKSLIELTFLNVLLFLIAKQFLKKFCFEV